MFFDSIEPGIWRSFNFLDLLRKCNVNMYMHILILSFIENGCYLMCFLISYGCFCWWILGLYFAGGYLDCIFSCSIWEEMFSAFILVYVKYLVISRMVFASVSRKSWSKLSWNFLELLKENVKVITAGVGLVEGLLWSPYDILVWRLDIKKRDARFRGFWIVSVWKGGRLVYMCGLRCLEFCSSRIWAPSLFFSVVVCIQCFEISNEVSNKDEVLMVSELW